MLTDGILYCQWEDIPGKEGGGAGVADRHLQLVLPSVRVSDILYGLHGSITGRHLGTRKALEKVQHWFYWPGQ